MIRAGIGVWTIKSSKGLLFMRSVLFETNVVSNSAIYSWHFLPYDVSNKICNWNLYKHILLQRTKKISLHWPDLFCIFWIEVSDGLSLGYSWKVECQAVLLRNRLRQIEYSNPTPCASCLIHINDDIDFGILSAIVLMNADNHEYMIAHYLTVDIFLSRISTQ